MVKIEHGKSMRNKAGSYLMDEVETIRTIEIFIPKPCGGGRIDDDGRQIEGSYVDVDEEKATRWRANPDLFCAEHCGFGDDIRGYLEWVECGGRPKCAGFTKAGGPCNNSTIYTIHNAAEKSPTTFGHDWCSHADTVQDWKLAHRRFFCRKHGGDMEAQVVDTRKRNNSGLEWHQLLADQPPPRQRLLELLFDVDRLHQE